MEGTHLAEEASAVDLGRALADEVRDLGVRLRDMRSEVDAEGRHASLPGARPGALPALPVQRLQAASVTRQPALRTKATNTPSLQVMFSLHSAGRVNFSHENRNVLLFFFSPMTSKGTV